jgi:hypothetical protein
MGFLPVVESFVLEAIQEDLNMITNLPMVTNLQVAFAMISLCYA